MNVFLVVPVGVEHKSPVGVFFERAQAEQAAKEVWLASDGYHTFEVQERKVGVVYDTFSRGLNFKPAQLPVQMEFVAEDSINRMGV